MTFRPTIIVVGVAISLFAQGGTLAQAPYEDSAFGIFGAFAANEYDYFQGRMGFNNDQYWAWAENHFRTLGAHWTRSNLQLTWDIVEPTIGGGYNWNNGMLTDGIIRRVYGPGNAVHWLGVFHEGGGPVPPPDRPALRNPLSYPNEYSAFVRAAVERYDGDGIGDADANVRVKYWQAGNEIPGWQSSGRTVQDYIQFVRMLREATRQADPESKLVLIATTSGLGVDLWLAQVIDALAAERAFDVIDIHHWGAAQTWQMTGVPQYRQRLDSLGLTDVQIWSCEHGTWQGQPTNQPSQTEQDQARSLVKRYLYNLNNGLNKLFWNNLMEWHQFGGQTGSIFNSMGLITDGQGPGEDPTRFNTARVAYWTYQLLAARIDTGRSTRLGLMPEVHVQNQAYGYAYQWRNSTRKLYVLWSESGTRSVTFSVGRPTAHLTNLITDRFGTVLEQRDIATIGGHITTDVGVDPVVIEEVQLRGDFDDDGNIALADFTQFGICFTGPGGTLAPGCEPGDFDLDNDIDCDDWSQFALAWTDAGQPPQFSQCSVATIPTISQWGLVILTILLMTAATIVIRRIRRTDAPRIALASCVVLVALITASAPAQAVQNPVGGGFVLVTERAGTTVAKIDLATDQIVGRATVGNQPSDLAVDHTRRWVYVAVNLDDRIVAMNADTLETSVLNIAGLGRQPIGVDVTPDGATLLVATRGSDGIISTDDRMDVIQLNASSWPPSGAIVASIPTGLHPVGVCISRDARQAVVTVRNQPAILIVDLQTNQIVAQAQNLPADAEPEGCDAHPTANVVYVTLHGPASTVEVFNLDTLTNVNHVPILPAPPARPSTGVFTPDGNRFYVSGQTVNKVFLFDSSNPLSPVQNTSVQLPVGPQPHFIAYFPDGRAYVANTNNGQPLGSLSVLHDYSTTPTVTGPILTTLAGPIRLAKFSSPGSGDFDFDGDVDAADATRFESCFTGPGGPPAAGCRPGDFDADGDIDCTDWAQFGLVWTGPEQLPQFAQCSVAGVPAVSPWELVTLTILLIAAATAVIERTRRAQTSRFANTCCVVLIGTITASAPARAAENWNPAVNMGPVVNSPLTEKAPEISPDGQTLYFSHHSSHGDINIFYSQWNGSAWGPPIDIGGVVNSSQNDWGPTLAGNGNTMYFASDRLGGYGGYDIYVTKRVGGVWQQPQNVGPTINSNVGELGQDTNPEETVLWFVRGWPESRPTGEDIFYSLKVDGQWTTPVLWELDTPYLEDNPDISPDGNKLYFTAIYDTLYGGGYGSFDIWVSERVGGVWKTPVNLGQSINTQYHDANPSISQDGGTLFFTRGDAPDGYGGFDLYWATRIPPSPGDFDGDGDVDLTDFAQLEICFTGPGSPLAPGCELGDFDLDNDVDCDDWAQFGLVWTGLGQLPQLSQCSTAGIPAVSQWGLITLTILLMTAATIVIRRIHRAHASPLAHIGWSRLPLSAFILP